MVGGGKCSGGGGKDRLVFVYMLFGLAKGFVRSVAVWWGNNDV